MIAKNGQKEEGIYLEKFQQKKVSLWLIGNNCLGTGIDNMFTEVVKAVISKKKK